MTKVHAFAEMTWLTTDAIFSELKPLALLGYIKALSCCDYLCIPASLLDTPPYLTLLELTSLRVPPPTGDSRLPTTVPPTPHPGSGRGRSICCSSKCCLIFELFGNLSLQSNGYLDILIKREFGNISHFAVHVIKHFLFSEEGLWCHHKRL